MEETEEEERDAKRSSNNLNMDTFFNHSPVTSNKQRKNANKTNEGRIYSNILAETLKVFNKLTIQSTINNSAYYDSEEDDNESDPKIEYLLVTHTSDGNERKIADTDTTNGNSPHKILTNREIPGIIQGFIPPFNQTTLDGVATSRGDFHAIRAVLHKKIVIDATCSCGCSQQPSSDKLEGREWANISS